MSIQDSSPARLRTHTTDLRSGRWLVDCVASTATFRARDFARRQVVGTFPVVAGHVDVAGRPVAAEAVLDVAGVATGIAKRDRDLRSRHFLDVAGYPTMVFTAADVEPGDRGTWTVAGTLLVRDVPCPVRLHVRLESLDDDCAVVVATTELDRRDAGIRTAPGFVVSHRVGVEVRARLGAPAPHG